MLQGSAVEKWRKLEEKVEFIKISDGPAASVLPVTIYYIIYYTVLALILYSWLSLRTTIIMDRLLGNDVAAVELKNLFVTVLTVEDELSTKESRRWLQSVVITMGGFFLEVDCPWNKDKVVLWMSANGDRLVRHIEVKHETSAPVLFDSWKFLYHTLPSLWMMNMKLTGRPDLEGKLARLVYFKPDESKLVVRITYNSEILVVHGIYVTTVPVVQTTEREEDSLP